MRKSVIIILALIMFVLVVIFFVSFGLIVDAFTPETVILENTKTGLRGEQIIEDDPIPYCGDELIFFRSVPVSLRDLDSIAPLGNLNPPAHTFPTDHLYFYLARNAPQDTITKRVPLQSPARAWVTTIKKSTHDGYTDYTLYLTPCHEVTLEFGHVSAIEERFLEALTDDTHCSSYETAGTMYTECRYENLLLPVEVNERLGFAGGLPGQYALDVGVYDRRITSVALINSFRFDHTRLGTPTCPLSYFSSDLRSELYTKVGRAGPDEFVRRTSEPICGTVFSDVPLTVQGMWFLASAPASTHEDNHLALVYDTYDPTIPVFSVGSSIPNIAPGVYSFAPSDTSTVNRRFNETRVSDQYCYEVSNKANVKVALLVQLTDEETLRVEAFSGQLCRTDLSFSDASVYFTR